MENHKKELKGKCTYCQKKIDEKYTSCYLCNKQRQKRDTIAKCADCGKEKNNIYKYCYDCFKVHKDDWKIKNHKNKIFINDSERINNVNNNNEL